LRGYTVIMARRAAVEALEGIGLAAAEGERPAGQGPDLPLPEPQRRKPK
jgi:hypothetical protein